MIAKVGTSHDHHGTRLSFAGVEQPWGALHTFHLEKEDYPGDEAQVCIIALVEKESRETVMEKRMHVHCYEQRGEVSKIGKDVPNVTLKLLGQCGTGFGWNTPNSGGLWLVCSGGIQFLCPGTFLLSCTSLCSNNEFWRVSCNKKEICGVLTPSKHSLQNDLIYVHKHFCTTMQISHHARFIDHAFHTQQISIFLENPECSKSI